MAIKLSCYLLVLWGVEVEVKSLPWMITRCMSQNSEILNSEYDNENRDLGVGVNAMQVIGWDKYQGRKSHYCNSNADLEALPSEK